MGNIHFKMGQYNKAIKYYRMALDQVWLSSWISSSCLKEILSGAKYAQNNAHQDYAQHWGPLCQNGWDLFLSLVLVKGIVSLSLCRSIQRCLLLFWMDHVRAGTLSSSSFCGGTTFSHALTQKGQFLPPKRPPNIFPPKPGRLQNRPPLDLVLLRHRRQRQDEEGLHPACGDSAWGLKFPVMRQYSGLFGIVVVIIASLDLPS